MAIIKLTTSTPLLDGLREKGATFYTFSPAINDLDKQRMNQGIAMSPSRFACIKLPDWVNPGDKPDLQTIFVNPTLMGASITQQQQPNLLFPKVIQNYMENMLQYAWSEKNDNTLSSAAELAFWKMLKKTGALKIVKDSTFTLNGKTYQSFKEIDESDDYEHIVKYVGDINILNNVDRNGQTYTEIMMYVPTNVGKTKNIKFIDSLNSFEHSLIPTTSGAEYSVGLDDHKDEVTKAVYDTIDRKYDLSSDEQRSVIWFDDEKLEHTEESFDFNAILIWYDVWNVEDPSTKVTNLMGILFMNDMNINTSGFGQWQNYEKLVSDKNGAGNSYVFRINLKNANKGTQVDTQVTINDSDTVSMTLYLEAIQRLNSLNSLYESIHTKYSELASKSYDIISAAQILGNLGDIGARVETLERLVKEGVDKNQISSSEMMEMLRTTKQTIAENPLATVIFNKITGNPIVKGDDLYVIDPNGEVWKWDKTELKWIIETE